MGALQSNYTWYVYSRDSKTDSWNKKAVYSFEKSSPSTIMIDLNLVFQENVFDIKPIY